MRRLLPLCLSLSALLPLGTAAHLSAQSAPAVVWQQVLKSATSGVDIRCAWIKGDSGWVLQIWNHGTTSIHMSYYISGQQDVSKIRENGRLHLKPKGFSFFPYASPSGTFVPSEIRLGKVDEGAFWRE